MNIQGIYIIRHKKSKKCYVGSSINVNGRIKCHFKALDLQKHANYKLQKAYNMYGKDAFEFETVEVVPLRADLLKREQYWMNTLKSVRKGYNICPKAGVYFRLAKLKRKTVRRRKKS